MRKVSVVGFAFLVCSSAWAQPDPGKPHVGGPTVKQPQAASAPSAPPAAPGTLASALEAVRTTDYPRAERELAALRGADQAAANTALARIMLEQGRFAEVEKYALIAQANATEKTAATTLRAQAMFESGKAPEALKLLEMVKDAPGPAGRRARLMLGDFRIKTGHRADASDPLMKIIEEYNADGIKSGDAEGLAMVGRAAHLLRSPKDANTSFNQSERVDKKNVEMLMWRAELFLEKYDPGHAEDVLKEVLAIAPKRADALVLMARVKLDQTLDFEAAEKLVKDALLINPKHAGAYAVRSGLALHDMDLAASDSAIASGLQINPNDLELWSLRAATKYLGDDSKGFESAKKETFARNPEYADFYGILGEFAEWEHRYDDIVAMMKEATKLDPEDGKAWAQLGLTQMRSGDETGGMDSLKKAWSKDHYNVRVFNTLNLYEQTIPNAYETGGGGVFKIRFPKDERAVLDRYLPRMLGEAWGSMKARYDFVPQNPVQVELYSNREQFSVRTSGLPNIGIQGVCFGRVVAAMSPKSEPFNWGNVVWHELGHVFAIQLSKNHVPRWFTEGLSEYETIARRPEWQRELDPELYLAIKRGTLPGSVDMNRAFTHASDGNDVTVAYYAASQMLVYTAEKYGMPKIVAALKLWGDGVRTPDVIQRAFGVSSSEYDRLFRAWEMERLIRYKTQFLFDDRAKPLDEAQAKVKASPNDASAHAALALSLLHAQKVDDAKKEVAAALKLDANDMNAHYLGSKLAGKDPDAQLAHLTAIQKAGGDGYSVRMGLAEVAEAKKDKTALRAAFEAAHRFDPTQGEPVKGLLDLAHEEKRETDEINLLKELAPLDQHDRKVWRMLLEKLVAAKRWPEARSVGESAIFVDVEHGPTHVSYARALSAVGDHAGAVYELESAILCAGPPKDVATAHALLAAELVTLKNSPEARKHLSEAQRLDPDNAEAKTVKIAP